MAMEDILKALVESRQQGQQSNTPQQASDPMAGLIGSLLGGGQAQSQSQANDPMASLIGGLLGGQSQQQPQAAPASGTTDLSGMMGLLEMFMGGQGSTTAGAASDPIMSMLTPFIAPLAKKVNISPQIATIVITFVVHKLLAHHPTSGRDSNTFNLDDMLGQMSTGKVDPNLLRQSGMVNELSKKTGLDDATTEQALQTAFSMVGKTVGGIRPNPKPASTGSGQKSAGRTLGATGAKRGPSRPRPK